MLLMHFNKYDESTDEYETGEVANVEQDDDDIVTVYLANGSWYFTLTRSDWEKVCKPVKVFRSIPK